MIRFEKLEQALQWVELNSRGECCVISSNQRLLMPAYPRNNFRLLETEVNLAGVASINVPPKKGIWV
jgi:hypothetical protein